MLLRNKLNDPAFVLGLGMTSLLLFFLMWRWFLRPIAGFEQDLIDGAAGVFLGMAIAFVCLAGWLTARRSR